MVERVTEQKLKNKRFRKTEKTIMTAFLIKDTLSVERLIKLAGISRSTFYRHHRTVYDIVPDYEKYILRKYTNAVKCLVKNKHIQLRTLYQRTLVFMYSNQEILDFLSKCGSQGVTEKIINVLKPKILSVSGITDDEVFKLYVKEVSGLIEVWQQKGFQKDEIFVVTNKISYLTNTAKVYLKPITST